MRELPIGHAKAAHPYAWLWEPLEEDATFALRSMFGFRAAYLHGKMVLVFCVKSEPWRGVLVCTSREHHPSLISQFPVLAPHEILGKWLYLPESSDAFDRVAEKIVRLVLDCDSRLGIVPSPKKKKAAGKSAKPRGR